MPNPPVVCLVPYSVFSYFHCLGYVRSHVLPTLLPAYAEKFNPVILNLIQKYQVEALKKVAYIEVVGTMGTFILSAIT
jgi:hypothetical protein